MPASINGILVAEERRDQLVKCKCCAPNARRVLVIPNGPETVAYVCPATRFCFVYGRTGNALASGFYTGNLDGV